ncbi:MAG: HAMP domain-containing histidine kinase [Bacteroidales bacterium]|nr:HAMP domain-containing histidine kinase [Bacteroidales bacterium]
MDQLALKIIIFIASGISFIMALYMWFLNYNARGIKGPRYWALANLIIGLGLFIRIFSPTFSFFIRSVSMLFVTTGLFVYLAGIWHYKNKKINPWIVFGIPALDLVQTIVFYLIIPNNRIRIDLHLVALIIFSALSIYEMLDVERERYYLRKIFRLNALYFAIFLILSLAGIVITLFRPMNPLHIEFVWLVAFGIAGGIMTALTFGYLSAVNLQLYIELRGQLKSKDKFFSIIAHDLKGPVGTQMNFLNLLNNQKDLEEDQKMKFLNNLEVLSQSTFHLLQNLLEWANTSGNIGQFEEERVDLNLLIDSNIKFYESLMLFKSITLEFHQDENMIVNGNSKMLETVIRNLVSNAIKFTPRGGKITISTQKNDQYVRLKVEDTGTGIDPKRLPHIFELENNSLSKGTEGETGSGLGLVLCKEFVTKNKGTIHAESELNAGTRMIVDLPLAR